MKFIVLLLVFSSFLYAQDTNNNPNDSAQQNTPQEPQQPKEEQKNNPPVEKPQPNPDQQKQVPPAAQSQQQPASPKPEEKKQPSAANQASSPEKQDKKPVPSSSEGKTPTVQQAVTVPQQALPPAPPEEPIPYYNPLHPQSPSTYQEGDLPSRESFSETAARKNRKHRLSISGKLLDFLAQGSLKKINSNISADYGYSRKYFEMGPYASFGLDGFDFELRQFQDELMLEAGAFFEINFMAHAKNTPSLGLKAGYKRKENMNYMVGQLYTTMKFFLNPQAALFISLAPYYQYKFSGQKGEWGVEIPTGLRFYFY